jgi:ABC-2 type transport system ATP-binding protein
MSISVKNLTKIYGTQTAVNNISFEVPSGKVFGFLGPNGAGKSTTMKILTGYIPQTEGHAEVCGYNVLSNSIEVRKLIGYLPEHNPLYKDMYVKEFLKFIADINNVAGVDKAISSVIDQTGLGIEQHKKIGALSKGYRQRVGLAQAIIHNPSVLILDEPTTGLDPNQLVEIRKLIVELGKEKTVLLSTHIMQEVQAMCDNVIIISEGNIVANDTTENLRKGIQKEVIITVEFQQDIDKNKLASIVGVRKVELLSPNKWIISSNNNKIDLRAELFNFAVANNLTILQLQKEEVDLEAVFKEVTK